MNIVGVLARARPEQAAAISEALAALAGVEVHAVGESGQIVLTVDLDQSEAGAEALVAIHNVPGVIGASLVYQHSEPD